MHLPPEVLRDIIRYVKPKSALCNLALCPKEIFKFVIPLLYEKIEVKNEHSSLRDLTYLFLQRPDLAQHVRQFTVGGRGNDDEPWEDSDESSKSNDSSKMIETLKKAIKASSVSKEEEEQWFMDLELGDEDAIMALLLPTLVKLEKLEHKRKFDCQYCTRMMKRAWQREKPFDENPAFQHLRDVVHIYADADKYGVDPNYLSLFTLLPAIRSVFGHFLGSDYSDEETPAVYEGLRPTPASSSLSHLELRDCRLKNEDLVRLLQVPKALKTFIYQVQFGHVSYCDVKPYQVRNAITPHEDFIENVWLEDECLYEDRDLHDFFPLVRSFSSFKCLKILRIEAGYLLYSLENIKLDDNNFNSILRRDLIDIFPRTLKTLEVIRCSDLVQHALEELILQKNAQVPNLVELILTGKKLQSKNLGDKFAKLAKICQGEHVSLCYKGYPPTRAGDMIQKLWGINETISWSESCLGWTVDVPLIVTKFRADGSLEEL